MTDRMTDTEIDRLLRGLDTPASAGDLALFVSQVRDLATQPPRATPELAELLARGLHRAPGDLVEVPAPAPDPASRRAAGQPRRRRTVFTFLAVVMAKVTSAGAVAQAAAGVSITLVGVTTAAAAGALPTGVQDPVSTVIESVTPLDVPDSGDEVAEAPAPDDGDEVAETPAAGEETPAPAPVDPADPTVPLDPEAPTEDDGAGETNFGARVSEDARDGGVDGRQISEEARARNGNAPEHAGTPGGKAGRAPVQGQPAEPAPAPEAAPADTAAAPVEEQPARAGGGHGGRAPR